MFIWVYLIPIKFGNIEDLGFSDSDEYLGKSNGKYKVFSIGSTKHNQLLDEGYSTVQTLDSLNQASKYLITCLLNEEDKTYYSNFMGINFKGLVRAIAGGSGGGSGITQQLVKNIFFTSDLASTNNIKNYNRKLTEILLSIYFSRNYSRDEILKAYLNNIYVSTDNKEQHGTLYGIKLASQYHFNKPIHKITLGEAAILVKYINKPFIAINKKIIKNIKRDLYSFEKNYIDNVIDTLAYKKEVLKFRRKGIETFIRCQ